MTTAPPTLPVFAPDGPSADPALEANLRALTTDGGQPTALWQAALDHHTVTRATSRSKLKLTLTVLSAAAVIVVAVGLILPSLGKGRSSARTSVGTIAFDANESPALDRVAKFREEAKEYDHRFLIEESAKHADSADPADHRVQSLDVQEQSDSGPSLQASTSLRSVIRKATLELAVADTREAFARCQHLLRPDLGEFVEASTLAASSEPEGANPGPPGIGPAPRVHQPGAQLTLRVAAAGGRMDEVLNQLRTLGKVDSENSTGDDVSAQVVDLDARLRNERQVEVELLKLLDSRQNAQLKDILDLRDKLSAVRSTIEQLQGRRDTLGRQISLASILILIHADTTEKPAPKPSSLFDGFSTEMSVAWTGGLAVLTQTIAFLVRVAVGGLVWWLLLLATIAIARRAIRRMIPDPAAIPLK